MKSSDNLYPKIVLVEQVSVPDNPDPGNQKLFIDISDHKLKRVDSAGILVNLESGGSGGGIPIDGWIEAGEAWVFVSVDDPSGVIDATGDARTEYSVGMRLRMTNGGNTIYGIITDVNQVLESGNTRITFLHEIDPATNQALHILANTPISLCRYSPVKIPFGFPMDKTHWSIKIIDSTTRQEITSSKGTWYNIGTTNEQISVPIGQWDLSYKVAAYSYNGSSNPNFSISVTLSKAAGTEDDVDFTYTGRVYGYSGGTSRGCQVCAQRLKTVNLTAKTLYYLNVMGDGESISELDINDVVGGTYISGNEMILQAICSYL